MDATSIARTLLKNSRSSKPWHVLSSGPRVAQAKEAKKAELAEKKKKEAEAADKKLEKERKAFEKAEKEKAAIAKMNEEMAARKAGGGNKKK